MKIIGILGGVASGKSFIADYFRELGAGTLDGDRLGHEILRLAEVEEAARARWGDSIFDDEGHIDRGSLASIVFAGDEDATAELAYLESLTHDRIGQRLQEEAEQMRASGEYPVVVLDAPVLIKAGWDQFCDQIVFVETEEGVRQERAQARGWDADELARREAAQTPLSTKRERSSTIIDNSGSPEATREQIRRYWTTVVN